MTKDGKQFRISRSQIQMVDLLLARQAVTRDSIFESLYGNRPDGGPESGTKIIDQMLVHIRKALMVQGIPILTTPMGWQIEQKHKPLVKKLVDDLRNSPYLGKRNSTKSSSFTPEKTKFVWKIDKDIPMPARDSYGNLKQYFFETMEMGDSVFIPYKDKKKLRYFVYSMYREHPELRHYKFFMDEREENDLTGTRVWRVEDDLTKKLPPSKRKG